ncbi:MAG: DUF6477 family protein [Pikeienuella sp.]
MLDTCSADRPARSRHRRTKHAPKPGLEPATRPASAPADDKPPSLCRPALLARAARRAAAGYQRARDLPAALPGLFGQAGPRIVEKLREAEARCETDRREGSVGYKPSRHVQILAALLAETQAHRPSPQPRDQPKASGSSALRRATKSRSASSTPGSIGGLT